MLTTQLGGPAIKNGSLFVVKYKIKKAGFSVRHPLNSGFTLLQGKYFTFNPQKWLRYEVDIDYFESIAHSDIHIVCNDSPTTNGLIDYETSLGILYAMINSKPIIITQKAQLSKTNDLLFREILTTRLPKLTVLDLKAMQSVEIQNALPKLSTPADYGLTQHEINLIKFRIKEHFRHLLTPTRNRRAFFAMVR